MAERLPQSTTPIIDGATLCRTSESTDQKPVFILHSNGKEFTVSFNCIGDLNPIVTHTTVAKAPIKQVKKTFPLSISKALTSFISEKPELKVDPEAEAIRKELKTLDIPPSFYFDSLICERANTAKLAKEKLEQEQEQAKLQQTDIERGVIHISNAPEELPELVHYEWIDKLIAAPHEMDNTPEPSELSLKSTAIDTFQSGLAKRTVESKHNYDLECCYIDTARIIPTLALPKKNGEVEQSQTISQSKIDRRAAGFIAITPKEGEYTPTQASWHNQAMRALLRGGKSESFCPSAIINGKLKLCFDGGPELKSAMEDKKFVPIDLFKSVCSDIEDKWEKGIYMCDLKPENMVCGNTNLFMVEGPLRFIDFDTVVIFINNEELSSQKGIVVGSKMYLTQGIITLRQYYIQKGYIAGDKYALLLTIMDATSPDFHALHRAAAKDIIKKSILDNSTELATEAECWVEKHVHPEYCNKVLEFLKDPIRHYNTFKLSEAINFDSQNLKCES